MDPDGAVRAMVGGRDYGVSQFNRATDALRQPGSSFKPFVYTTALSAGLYKPTTIVTDAPICIGNWCPQNYARSYAGSLPLVVALAKSINTIPVRMSLALGGGNAKIGRAKIIDMCRRMGLTTALTDSVSLPIGAAEVTVIDMTAGYAVFANGGKRAVPYASVEIRNSRGDAIFRHGRDTPKPQQVVATSVVADMNYMLSKVVEEGTGRRAALEGVRVAGKTGTTNAYRDAWFIGFSGNLVAGIWMGNDDYASTNKMTGGTLPAMTWHDMMQPAHQNLELRPIPGIQPGDGPVQPLIAKGPGAVQASLVEIASPPRPAPTNGLSRKSFEVIGAIGDLFRSVDQAALDPDASGASVAGRPGGGARAIGGRIALP
jgi:penicillin-binding protein 1A